MNQRAPAWALATALVAYTAYAGATVWALRDRIQPDAVAYLRHAAYVADARWADAIAGYWSPLLIWTTAPLMAAGVDPLLAARIPLLLGGAGVVTAAWVLMQRFDPLPSGLTLVGTLFAAEVVTRWTAVVFPDLLLACFVLAGMAVLASRSFLERTSLQVLCGVLGGMGFLAKAYGLPFFVVSLPVSLLIVHFGQPRRRLVHAWALAMAGFFLVAAPWVAVVSWKYDRFTWGTSAAINHGITRYDQPVVTTLHSPGPGQVTIWETPDAIPYRTWVPWESREAALFEMTHAWSTAKTIRDSLARFDALGLSVALIALGPFFLLAIGEVREFRRSLWIASTVALYCAGFLFVYFTYRYVEPVLKPLCVISCFGLSWKVSRRIEAPWLRRGAVGIVILSFALHVGVPFEPHRLHEPGGTPFNDVTVDSRPHRALASRIRSEGLQGPVASDLYWAGMYVCYFLDAPFAGSPAVDEDLPTVRAGLERTGVRTLILNRDGRLAAVFAEDPSWTLRFTEEAAGTTVDVYSRAVGSP